MSSSLESKSNSLEIKESQGEEKSNKVVATNNLKLDSFTQTRQNVVTDLIPLQETDLIESERQLKSEIRIDAVEKSEIEIDIEVESEKKKNKNEEQLTKVEKMEEITRPSSACSSSFSSTSLSDDNNLPISFPPRQRHHIGDGVYGLCKVLRFAKVGRIPRPKIYYHNIEGKKREQYNAPTLVQAIGQVPSSCDNLPNSLTMASRNDHTPADNRHGGSSSSGEGGGRRRCTGEAAGSSYRPASSNQPYSSYAFPRNGTNWRPSPPFHAPSMNLDRRHDDHLTNLDRRYGESISIDPRYGENGWRDAVPPYQHNIHPYHRPPFDHDDHSQQQQQAPHQPNFAPFYSKQKARQRAYYEQQQLQLHRERYPIVPPLPLPHHDRGPPSGYGREFNRPLHLADQFPPWQNGGASRPCLHLHDRGETMLPPWVAAGQDRYDPYVDCGGGGGGGCGSSGNSSGRSYNDNWREDVDLVRKGILNRTRIC